MYSLATLNCCVAGDIPNEQQVALLQRALYELSLPASDDLSAAVKCGGAVSAITDTGGQIGPYSYTSPAFVRVPRVIDELLQVQPRLGHPMARLTTAAAALSDFSFFRATSDANVFSKSEIWKPAVFDALSLVSSAVPVLSCSSGNESAHFLLPPVEHDSSVTLRCIPLTPTGVAFHLLL